MNNKSETRVENKKLFNPEANNKCKLFTGDTDNLIDMIDQTIPDFYQRHSEKMFANMWHPHKIPLCDDMEDFKNLTSAERETFDRALSHLSGLDSYQVNNLPDIASRIRYPEIVAILGMQVGQEGLHSYSYAYTFNTLYTKEDARRVRDTLKTDSIMRKRAVDLTDIYETTLYDDSLRGQLEILLMNLTLEGIMFYNIFNFFFYFKYQGRMVNTAVNISYIKKDELTHVLIFVEILLVFKKDYPDEWDEDFIVQFIDNQVQLEIEYSSYIIDSSILGFSKDNISKYTKYRANMLFKQLGIDTRYKDASNPFRHLERASNVGNELEPDVNSTETAIFEAHSTNYFDPAVKIDDFNDFVRGQV